MRVIVAVATIVLLSLAVLFNARTEGTENAAISDSSSDAVHWVKLTLGLDDKAVPWDGSVTITNGRILQSAPWSFEPRDRFDPVAHKWFCTTVVLKGRSASSFAEPQRGVLIKIERAGNTKLEIQTQQGNFTVDVPALKAGVPQSYLESRASAELLGNSDNLPNTAIDSIAVTEDDFPTLVVDKSGNRWLAWIGYEDAAKRDHLRVMNLDDPNAKVEEVLTAREQTDPKLVLDSEGTPRLFWSAPEDGNWDLWMSKRTEHGWSNAERITTAEGTDFHLAVARGPNGALWLAWQAFRGTNSDLFAKRLHQGKWSKTIRITDDVSNEWEPSISVDRMGTAWIGYDSYRNGNYDVFCDKRVARQKRQCKAGKNVRDCRHRRFRSPCLR